jgi:hypothetical protein
MPIFMKVRSLIQMFSRHDDGSAGDANYGLIGAGYARYRRPDPRIGHFIANGLADARTVLNVGAGACSYEPTDRSVTAVVPSASMRAQRPTSLPAAVDAVAEHLPFENDSFDAAMAITPCISGSTGSATASRPPCDVISNEALGTGHMGTFERNLYLRVL